MIKKAISLFALTVGALLSAGCPPVSNPRDVTVELDDSLRAQLTHNVEVDIIAVNSTEATDHWQDYSMTKYFQPGDERRLSVPTCVMIFDPKKPGAQTLSAKDPLWAKWFAASPKEAYMQLFVLAQLPSMISDAPGVKDPRRLIIPLVNERWDHRENSPIVIKVQADKLVDTTPPDPADK